MGTLSQSHPVNRAITKIGDSTEALVHCVVPQPGLEVESEPAPIAADTGALDAASMEQLMEDIKLKGVEALRNDENRSKAQLRGPGIRYVEASPSAVTSDLFKLRLDHGLPSPPDPKNLHLPDPDMNSSRSTIFVAGFPYGYRATSEAEASLWDYLDRLSRVLSLRVVTDSNTRFIRHVFADFESEDEARKVISVIPNHLFRTLRLRAEMSRIGRTITFCSRGPIEFLSIFDLADLKPDERKALSDETWPGMKPFNSYLVKKLASIFGELENVKELRCKGDERIYEVVYVQRNTAKRASEAFCTVPMATNFAVRYRGPSKSLSQYGIISDRGGCRVPPPALANSSSVRADNTTEASTRCSSMLTTPRWVPQHGGGAPPLTLLQKTGSDSLEFTGVSGPIATPSNQDWSERSIISSHAHLSENVKDHRKMMEAPLKVVAPSSVSQEARTAPETMSWADQASKELDGKVESVQPYAQDDDQARGELVLRPAKDEEVQAVRQASPPPECGGDIKPERIESLLTQPVVQPPKRKEELFKGFPASYYPNIDAFSIWVGSLSFDTTGNILREIFARFGKVIDVQIRPNFAFIRFETKEAAARALEKENGPFYRQKNIVVRPKEHRMMPRRVSTQLSQGHRVAFGRYAQERGGRGHNNSKGIIIRRNDDSGPQPGVGGHPLPSTPSVDYNLTLNRYVASQGSGPRKTKLYRGHPGGGASMMRARPPMRWSNAQPAATTTMAQMDHSVAQASTQKPAFQPPSGPIVGIHGEPMAMPNAYSCGPLQMPFYYTTCANGQQMLAYPQPWPCHAGDSIPVYGTPSAEPAEAADQESRSNGGIATAQPHAGDAHCVDIPAAGVDVPPESDGLFAPLTPHSSESSRGDASAPGTQPCSPAHRAEHTATIQTIAYPGAPQGKAGAGTGAGHFAPGSSGEAHYAWGPQAAQQPGGAAQMPMQMMQQIVSWSSHPSEPPYHVPLWQAIPSQPGQPPIFRYVQGSLSPSFSQHPRCHEEQGRSTHCHDPSRLPFGVIQGPPGGHFAAFPFGPVYPPVPVGLGHAAGRSSQPSSSHSSHYTSPGLSLHGADDRVRSETNSSLRSLTEQGSIGPGAASGSETNEPTSPMPFVEYGEINSCGPGRIEMIEVPSYAADA